ncbi:MAG: Crp/Fnr family transcriptional regulator [Gammaproteobacteria bacterium]|nr:Crp/Fnr family transcriptional regulator [Gammaproteobacteria bacterium]
MNFLRKFRNWEHVDEVGDGEVIFTENEPADVLFVVLSGEVQLSLRGEVLANEGEGGIVGEMAMIESADNSTTATAIGEVRLARVDRDQLRQVIAKNGDFSMHVMGVLANRLRSVDQYIATHFGLPG